MCAVNVTKVLFDWDFQTVPARLKTARLLDRLLRAQGSARFYSARQIASGFGQTLIG